MWVCGCVSVWVCECMGGRAFSGGLGGELVLVVGIAPPCSDFQYPRSDRIGCYLWIPPAWLLSNVRFQYPRSDRIGCYLLRQRIRGLEVECFQYPRSDRIGCYRPCRNAQWRPLGPVALVLGLRAPLVYVCGLTIQCALVISRGSSANGFLQPGPCHLREWQGVLVRDGNGTNRGS